jgi:hypothetical protein
VQARLSKQDEDDEDEDDDVWEAIVADTCVKVCESAQSDPEAGVAAWLLEPDEMPEQQSNSTWDKYVTTLIMRIHPGCPGCVEHQILREYLTRHEGLQSTDGSYRIAALHVIVHWDQRDGFLDSLTASVRPLAKLVPELSLQDKIAQIVDPPLSDEEEDEDEEIDVADRLRMMMFSEFYKFMQDQAGSESTAKVMRAWAAAVREAKLQDVTATERYQSFKQHDAMCIVQLAIECASSVAASMSLLRNLITKLDVLVQRDDNQVRLRLVEIWDALEPTSSGVCLLTPALVHRLFKLWADRDEESDLRFVVDNVLCSESLTIAQQVPMLEAALIGHEWSQVQDSLKSRSSNANEFLVVWLSFETGGRCCEKLSKLLEDKLKTDGQLWGDGDKREYIPHWLEGLPEGVPGQKGDLSPPFSDRDSPQQADRDVDLGLGDADWVHPRDLSADLDQTETQHVTESSEHGDLVETLKPYRGELSSESADDVGSDGCQRPALTFRGEMLAAMATHEDADPSSGSEDFDSVGGVADATTPSMHQEPEPEPQLDRTEVELEQRTSPAMQLAHAFFHLVWKWLVLHHHDSSLADLHEARPSFVE